MKVCTNLHLFFSYNVIAQMGKAGKCVARLLHFCDRLFLFLSSAVTNQRGGKRSNPSACRGCASTNVRGVVTAHFGVRKGKMEIIQIDPAALVPYENNTKTHPPEQVDRIAESIKRFGWQQPIVVDRDNVVIIGHGRLMAAKQLMLDTVPVVYADNLSEEEAQALRLADNKTNESPWDFGKLEEELAALSIAGVDMTAFGFDDSEDELPPENLDNPEGFNETLACKLTFDSFAEYNDHEEEIKEFAERIGATFSVVKT